jgi:hypothetical protein
LRIEDRKWKIAILDPPFSILDLANECASPLSLFEQLAKVFSATHEILDDWLVLAIPRARLAREGAMFLVAVASAAVIEASYGRRVT